MDWHYDARCVIWALGMSIFLHFFMYELMISITFRFYLCPEDTRRARMGGDNENRPKRRQMRRLGLMVCVSFVSCLPTNHFLNLF
jgi:hypothetical protein